MRYLPYLIVLSLVAGACSPDFDAAVRKSALGGGKTLTRLYTSAPGKLRYLLAREGIDVTGSHHRLGFVDVYATPEERDQLVSRYAGRIRTVGHLSTRSPLALSDYHDPAEILAFLDQVESDYPEIAMKVILEDTLFEGHAIYAMKISDNVATDEDEPTFLMDGQIHAREVMTAEVQMDAIDYLTSNYGIAADVTRWVDAMEIWIVPVVNPDGAAYVHSSDPMWRTNRHPGCGVDLNRNFSWSYRRCWGSSDQCGDETYHGQGPNSEPETRAQDALMAALRPMYYINYHTYGEYIVWPGGCGRVDDHELFLSVGTQLNSRVRTDDGQTGHWTIGNVPDAMYPAPGGADDQAYGAHGAIAFTFELNSSSFQPDYATWRDLTAIRQRDAWGYLMERTLTGPALTGHTYDAATSDPVVATYRFADQPFKNDQAPLRTDAAGRFGRAVLPNSEHLAIFTAGGYLPENHPVHVNAMPVDLDVPMTAGVNHAPAADAGDDQTVNESDTVLLDAGGSSDPDGNMLVYRWTQTEGPAVYLKDKITATPTFFAPSVNRDTPLTLEVTVSDGELEGAADQVTVIVRDVWNESSDYPSTDTPQNIPDYDPVGITSIIHVQEDRLVLKATIQVNITHTWIGDLGITLTSPEGTQVVLHNHESEDRHDLHAVYEPPKFIGESSGGDWVLFILDVGPDDVGRLSSWTLTLDLAGDPPCVNAADCDLPQVHTHACNAGRCEIVSCDPGWSDCNDYRLDGCETDPRTDTHHCGGCGNACPPGSQCKAGTCREVGDNDGCGCGGLQRFPAALSSQGHRPGGSQGMSTAGSMCECWFILMALGLLVIRRHREAG
jgi:subtilisin-like proprotein convertase family protein